MCHPAVFIGLGALQMQQSASQAKSAAIAQGKAYEANAKNAMSAFVDNSRQLNLKNRQEKEAAMTAKMQSDLKGMQLKATAKVAGANSGVFLNNDAVMQNLTRQALVSGSSISSNLGQVEAQLQEARYGASTTYQSRINSVTAPTFDRSNVMLNAAIAGVQTGMAAYSTFGNMGGGSTGLDLSVGPDGVGPPMPR